jgi:hypothetical protein
MSTKTQSVIDLVRIKSWYIPGSAQAYAALKASSMPLLIFSRDFLPTLHLAIRRSGAVTKEVPWDQIFGPAMDKIGLQWKSKQGRTCRITDNKMVFLCAPSEANRKAISSLDVCLRKFFARWAFRYHAEFSENATKFKLVVNFKFDPDTMPVMPVFEPEAEREYELVLGFTKMKLTFFDKRPNGPRFANIIAPLVLFEVFTQAGSEWVPTFSSTCSPSQIGDVSQFAGGYAELFNRMKSNEERR